jgi:hypothetical protein
VRVVEPGSAEAEHYPTGFGVRISNMVPEQRQRLAGMLARLQIGGSLY